MRLVPFLLCCIARQTVAIRSFSGSRGTLALLVPGIRREEKYIIDREARRRVATASKKKATRLAMASSQIASAEMNRKIESELSGWPLLCSRERRDISKAAARTTGKWLLSLFHWNVLADGLCSTLPDRGGFVCSPTDSLLWSKRKWRMLEELIKWDTDLITLCEVDHYQDWIFPMLTRLGYRGIFMKKPSSPSLQFSSLEDGCCIMYKGDKLDLLSSHCFTYAIREHTGPTVCPVVDTEISAGADRKIMNQVAILCLFRHKEQTTDSLDTNGYVIVATTHLKAEKSAIGELVRQAEVRQLLDETSKFRVNAGAGLGLDPSTIPVIITGDMNATPYRSSGDNHGGTAVPYDPLCWEELINSPLGLKSAYPVDNSLFTTWKIRPKKGGVDSCPADCGRIKGEAGTDPHAHAVKETKHCIDYIMCCGGVEVLEVVDMPSEDDVGPCRVPSYTYASDHFSLISKLQITAPSPALELPPTQSEI